MTTGIPIGFDAQGRQIYYRKGGHILLVAPPRSGKATTILIPLMLQYQHGSMICIDPKGELAAVTGARRARMGQRVIIINPFKILPNVLAPGTEHFKGVED